MGAKDFFVKDFDTPNEVVAKIKDFFENGYYRLKIAANDLDAPNLAKDVFESHSFLCFKCQKEKIIKIKMIDQKKETFQGKFICPDCEEGEN